MSELYVFIAIYVVFVVYIAYAYKSKKWPFQSKEQPKSNSTLSETVVQMESTSTENSGIGILVLIIFIAVFALSAIAAYFSVKMSMKRYGVAESALKQGNTGVAVAALSPEIGEGIGDVMSRLWSPTNPNSR